MSKLATARDTASKEERDWMDASQRLHEANLELDHAHAEYVMAQAQCYQALTRWEHVLQFRKKRKA